MVKQMPVLRNYALMALTHLFMALAYAGPIDPSHPHLTLTSTNLAKNSNGAVQDDVVHVALKTKHDSEHFVLPEPKHGAESVLVPLAGRVQQVKGVPSIEYKFSRRITLSNPGAEPVSIGFDSGNDWRVHSYDILDFNQILPIELTEFEFLATPEEMRKYGLKANRLACVIEYTVYGSKVKYQVKLHPVRISRTIALKTQLIVERGRPTHYEIACGGPADQWIKLAGVRSANSKKTLIPLASAAPAEPAPSFDAGVALPAR